LVEFGDMEVIVATAEHLSDMKRTTLLSLLPHAFTKNDLDKARVAQV